MGGLYLSKRPADIYTFVTYRQWLAENLSRLESEYQAKKVEAAGSRLVHYQVVRNNFQSMYERALFTSKYMPPAELDLPLWRSGLSPSDAADPSAARQVRSNVPAYFDRRKPLQAIQLINLLPMSEPIQPRPCRTAKSRHESARESRGVVGCQCHGCRLGKPRISDNFC